jgi:hypothetical protein
MRKPAEKNESEGLLWLRLCVFKNSSLEERVKRRVPLYS